ncbi:MAG: hypothetical protein ACYDAH_19435 [Steroidobacteraceae bacterium]
MSEPPGQRKDSDKFAAAHAADCGAGEMERLFSSLEAQLLYGKAPVFRCAPDTAAIKDM